MARDFREVRPKPEEVIPFQLMAVVVENDPKVPWVVAVFTNGPHKGERTYVFPDGWSSEMQDRALIEWGVEL
jgi:hypothetical protein